MEVNWVVIVFTLLLIDSIGAVVMSWFGQCWWVQLAGPLADHFPPAKGWTLVYFCLVLVIGYLLGVL